MAACADRGASADDGELLAGLRAGNEDAFRTLLARLGPAMLRTARLFVRDEQVAEEIVQETWIAVFRSVERFEGRSSLRAWIFTILGNTARRRGKSEDRSRPFSSGAESVELDALLSANHPRWASCWSTIVPRWDEIPEEKLLAAETREAIVAVVKELPPSQCAVLTLRDIERWDADEVAQVLGLTPGNQRVLLHRARLAVRNALETVIQA